MNRFRVRISLAAAVVVAIGVAVPLAAATAAVPSGPAATPAGPVVFQDDFSGAAGAPDPSRWTDYSACGYNPSAAFGSITCGTSERLDGAGHLVVPATPRSGSGIRTGDRFGFVYGTASAWIKLPPQAGYWPAFWTLNSPADGSAQLPVGEVDAMEGYTTWLDAYHATAHDYGVGGSRYDAGDSLCAQASKVDLSAGFHKYSARIEPGKVTFFFDDVQCGPVHTKAPGRPWAFGPDVTRPNWLILDLAVGGASGQQKPATVDAQMLVDRVEVRALESAVPTAAPSPAVSPAASPGAPATPGSPPSPSPATVVSNNGVYRLVNDCGGLVMEVPDSATTGTPLQTGRWSGRDGQRWRMVAVDSGYYKLINVGSGQAANVAYASQGDGARLIQYPDVSGPNAQWRVTIAANGVATLVARHSGKALDVRAGSAAVGAVVDQAAPAAGCAQVWRLVSS